MTESTETRTQVQIILQAIFDTGSISDVALMKAIDGTVGDTSIAPVLSYLRTHKYIQTDEDAAGEKTHRIVDAALCEVKLAAQRGAIVRPATVESPVSVSRSINDALKRANCDVAPLLQKPQMAHLGQLATPVVTPKPPTKAALGSVVVDLAKEWRKTVPKIHSVGVGGDHGVPVICVYTTAELTKMECGMLPQRSHGAEVVIRRAPTLPVKHSPPISLRVIAEVNKDDVNGLPPEVVKELSTKAQTLVDNVKTIDDVMPEAATALTKACATEPTPIEPAVIRPKPGALSKRRLERAIEFLSDYAQILTDVACDDKGADLSERDEVDAIVEWLRASFVLDEAPGVIHSREHETHDVERMEFGINQDGRLLIVGRSETLAMEPGAWAPLARMLAALLPVHT